jgi:hypothetical protein
MTAQPVLVNGSDIQKSATATTMDSRFLSLGRASKARPLSSVILDVLPLGAARLVSWDGMLLLFYAWPKQFQQKSA